MGVGFPTPLKSGVPRVPVYRPLLNPYKHWLKPPHLFGTPKIQREKGVPH